jgi:hypothetical protein
MAKTIKQKFILDESGSMLSQQQVVIDGFNEQLDMMKKEEATGEVKYLVSLTKFSEKVEKVFTDVPLADVKRLTKEDYAPNGGTALFDAIGATISTAGRGETDVMVSIMTDGHENSSKEWKHSAIKTLIQLRERENKWGFVYFGANQDAFSAASSIGMSNAVNYAVANTGMAMQAMSSVRAAYTTSALSGNYNVSNLTCNVDQSSLTNTDYSNLINSSNPFSPNYKGSK